VLTGRRAIEQHLASCSGWAQSDARAASELVRDASLMLASVVCKDGAHWVWDVVESDEDGWLPPATLPPAPCPLPPHH